MNKNKKTKKYRIKKYSIAWFTKEIIGCIPTLLVCIAVLLGMIFLASADSITDILLSRIGLI